MTTEDLHARRVQAVRAWTRFVEEGDGGATAVRPEILRSWELSGVVSPTVTHAPLADEGDTADFWKQSPLQTAVERVQDELRRTAEDGDLVIALASGTADAHLDRLRVAASDVVARAIRVAVGEPA